MADRILKNFESINACITLTLPPSKSVINRLIVIKKLLLQNSSLTFKEWFNEDWTDVNDIKLMWEGIRSTEQVFNVEDAGTVMRFLTAFFAQCEDFSIELHGTPIMNERPIGPLVKYLNALGANVKEKSFDGFPPLSIHGNQLTGGELNATNDISSQYISALLLISPYLKSPLTINLSSDQISYSYIQLTVHLMRHFGAKVTSNHNQIVVQDVGYTDTPTEGLNLVDWSSLGYILAWLLLRPSYKIFIPNLTLRSYHPEEEILNVLLHFGLVWDEKVSGIEFQVKKQDYPNIIILDGSNFPDAIPTLACLCTSLCIPFNFTNVHHLEVKESKRATELVHSLSKCGVNITFQGNSLFTTGFNGQTDSTLVLDSQNDHRLSMSYSLLAHRFPNLIIKDSEVTGKSYPHFWDDLAKCGIHFSLVS